MKYEKLEALLKKADNIVFFGGAGVSTESGIPDFRGAGGVYTEEFGELQAELIVSGRFFKRSPEVFYEFYKAKMLFPDAKPNRAHRALAALEREGKLRAVVTQNIDGLHQAAGSRNVIELHGTAHRNYCLKCSAEYDLNYIVKSAGVPLCERCGGLVKPRVTLFDEALPDGAIESAVAAIRRADLLIAAGTSLIVQPAASLINYFAGEDLVVINYDATSADGSASLVIRDAVGEVLFSAVTGIGIEV